MDAIFDLMINILKFAVAGGFIVLGLKILKIKKSGTVKAEVLYLQSKLSKARLALKGKIKKKSNVFRAFSKTGISEGDPLDTALKQLVENNFETSQNFQDYFDVSRKIVSLVHVDKNGTHDSSIVADIENDFMCSDFKTEMDIMKIIKEMTDLSTKINATITANNQSNPENPIEKVDSLTFKSLADVNRVFKVDLDYQEPDASANSPKKAS